MELSQRGNKKKSLVLTVRSWGIEFGFCMLISMLLLPCFSSTGDPCTPATPSNIWNLVNEGTSASVGHSYSFSTSSLWTVSPFMLTFPSTYKNQNEHKYAIPQRKSNKMTHSESPDNIAIDNHSPPKKNISYMLWLALAIRAAINVILEGLFKRYFTFSGHFTLNYISPSPHLGCAFILK